MNASNKKFLRRSLILVASVTIVTLAFVGVQWLYPRGMGLYYQVQGGKQLRAVLREAGIDEDVACITKPLTDEVAIQGLEQAISSLKNAIHYNPSSAQVYLHLGRSYCWLGQYQNASESYKDYIQFHPKNPLGHLERGFSLAALYSHEKSPDVKARAIQEWLIADYSPTILISLADQAFTKRQFQQAINLYSFGTLSDDFLPVHALRWAISSAVTHSQIPSQSELILPIHVYDWNNNSLKIEAEEMLWIRDVFQNWEPYGKPLKSYPAAIPNVGAMWWSGPAIAFIRISESGFYHVTILAQETFPAPVKLQLEENLVSVAEFSLEKQDLSWQPLETEIFLSAGIHVIGIRLLNDEAVDGVDRNAAIDYIQFAK